MNDRNIGNMTQVPRPPALSDERRAELMRQATLDGQLWFAAERGKVADIERLAVEGASPNAKVDEMPALYMAARAGHADAVSTLVRLGAALNAMTKDGRTALMATAINGRVECARALLAGGADRHIISLVTPTEDAMTALEFAERRGETDVAALLQSDQPSLNPEARSRVSALTEEAMEHFTSQRFGESISALEEAQSLDPTDEDVSNTLEFVRGAAGVVDASQRQAAALDEDLWNAAERGDAMVIERLVAEGASPDATDDEDDDPAVVIAATRGHVGVVSELFRLGADLDATNPDGETALMCAAQFGKVESARALLAGGADRTLRATGGRDEGKTALEIAEKFGKAEVAALLRE